MAMLMYLSVECPHWFRCNAVRIEVLQKLCRVQNNHCNRASSSAFGVRRSYRCLFSLAILKYYCVTWTLCVREMCFSEALSTPWIFRPRLKKKTFFNCININLLRCIRLEIFLRSSSSSSISKELKMIYAYYY